MALPLLEAALAADPDDLPAWEAKGLALGRLDRPDEGLDAFRTALARGSAGEETWVCAAYLAAQAGRRDDATAYWQHAIATSPWRPDYHAELALVYFGGRDWNRAAEACRETLKLNPAHVEVRKLLIQSYCELGNERTARAEFEILLGFDPPDRGALLRWFSSQLRSGSHRP